MLNKSVFRSFLALNLLPITGSSLSLSLSLSLSSCSNVKLNSSLLPESINVGEIFNFQQHDESVNTIYKVKSTKENFVVDPNDQTLVTTLKDYLIEGNESNYFPSEMVITVLTNNTIHITPRTDSVHYAVGSSVETTYSLVAKSTLTPDDTFSVLINFSDEGKPTKSDFISGMETVGIYINQLIVPEVDSVDVQKVNDYVYVVLAKPGSGSLIYQNNLRFVFMKSGLSLNNLVKNTDLGSINTGAKKATPTIEQIKPALAKYNPNLSTEIINSLSVKSCAGSSFTKTVVLETSLDYFTGGKETQLTLFSCDNDTLLVKYSFNTSNMKDQQSSPNSLPNADDDGWRDISNGVTFQKYNNNNDLRIIYNKNTKDFTSVWYKNSPANLSMLVGIAGVTNNLKTLAIGSNLFWNYDPGKTLYLNNLVAPNLESVLAENSCYEKFIFSSPDSYSPELWNHSGYDNPQGETPRYGFAPNYREGGPSQSGAYFNPSLPFYLYCTDISFYGFEYPTPLLFTEHKWKTGFDDAGAWGPSVNIHLLFGSNIKCGVIPRKTSAPNGEKVQWNYIYDL